MQHDSIEGEVLAKKFHWVCFFVGVSHVVLGVACAVWHWRGAGDHADNIRRLTGGGL
jgi:hypothetical protein